MVDNDSILLEALMEGLDGALLTMIRVPELVIIEGIGERLANNLNLTTCSKIVKITYVCTAISQ